MLAEAWLWFAVALGPILFGAVEPWSVLLLQGTLALFPAICALTLPARREKILDVPFMPALLFILAIGVLQLLFPRPLLGPQTSLFSTADPARTAAALILGACYASFLLCASRVLSRPGAARRFAWVLFLIGGAIAAIGLLQISQGNASIYGLRPVASDRNPFGPYYNRNHAASLLAMSAAVGAGLVGGLFLKRRRSFGDKSDLAAQLTLMALPACAIAAGLWSISARGAILGLAGAFALVFLLKRADTRAKKAVLALSMIAAAALLYRPLTARTDSSIVTRLSMYRSAAELLKDSPAFGVGLGALMPAMSPYRELWVDGVIDHLHSDWGEAAVETGWVGLAALVLGFGAFLTKSAGLDGASSERSRAIRAGALAASVAGALHALVEFNLSIPGNAVFFLAVVSLAGAREAGDDAVPALAPAGARARLLPLLAAVAFGFLLARGARSVARDLRRAGAPLQAAARLIALQPVRSSSDYDFRLAFLCFQSAQSENSRRLEFLRQALAHARSGLLFDPAASHGNRLTGAILGALGRDSDARFHLARKTVPGP